MAHMLHVAPTHQFAQVQVQTPWERDASVARPLQYPVTVQFEHVG